MRKPKYHAALALLPLLVVPGCEKVKQAGTTLKQQISNVKTLVKTEAESTAPPSSPSGSTEEHLDEEEQSQAAQLKPAYDPVHEEMNAFFNEVNGLLTTHRFDELEARATELRTAKPKFSNGSWQIRQFYEALSCPSHEEMDWRVCEKHLKDWLAAQPKSITAHVAYANFLIDYAQEARNLNYVCMVTPEGWLLLNDKQFSKIGLAGAQDSLPGPRGVHLFRERLAQAYQLLAQARQLPARDLYWWAATLRMALDQDWPAHDLDALVNEAHAFEPQYWGYDTARAYSLLPRRSGGQQGAWEAYAEESAKRPGGPGAEAYARIVIYLLHFQNITFTKSGASWPRTREGLALMRERYPKSLDAVSYSALLATYAKDRELAKTMFERLGDTYLPHVWREPQHFTHYRKWALTGQW